MAVRRIPRAPAAPDPTALAVRIELAEADQLACTGPPGPEGALEIAGGVAVSKGPRSPSSSAFALGLAGPVAPEDLDRVEAHLGALGGQVRVELCAGADASLAVELGRRGYRVERLLLVLARAVAAPPAAPGRVGRLRVREIEAGEEGAFAEAFARAHLGEPIATGGAEDRAVSLPGAGRSACFAALDGRSPVAVAVVSEHAGLASLSGGGVLPAWRGRGIQLALVQARLAWAASRGCDVAAAAVESGSASQRTLERAGFRVAYPKAVMVRGG